MNKSAAEPVVKESTVHIGDKEYKVIGIFEGNQTASKLLYDMAVSRVLNEPHLPMENDGEVR